MAAEGPGGGLSINALSDDLLAAVLGAVPDSAQLRLLAGTCRRWAALLRTRLELWADVRLALPPKRSRGRDRRNSYTTPCALDVGRLAAWLAARAAAVASLEVALLYPDAAALLPGLLPPLAPTLRRLVLRGHAADWPYFSVDWRWLGGMGQLESLELWNALPGLAELALPPSLTELIVDRVGEADPDTEGWDELPAGFSRLTSLRKLTLGTAATYLLQADEESAFKPLRAAVQLRELRLTEGALSAVPDALTALAQLTLLSFRGKRPPPRGCDRLEAFGDMCQHKADPFQPLRTLARLRLLDFTRCALDRLPPGLAWLPELRTLLLADNQLTALPAPAPTPSAAQPPVGGSCMAASPRRRHDQQRGATLPSPSPRAAAAAQAEAAAGLPPRLAALVLAGNRFAALPAAALAACPALAELDLSRCWQLQPTPAEWHALLPALTRLRSLRHSCPLLAAETRGYGGGACLAAAVGGCPDLQLDFCSTAASRCRALAPAADDAADCAAGTSTAGAGAGAAKRARSCGSLLDLEAAAAALLGAGASPWAHTTLAELAATASGGDGGQRAAPI